MCGYMYGGCYWLVFDFIDFHKAAFMANFASTPIRGAAVEIKVLSILHLALPHASTFFPFLIVACFSCNTSMASREKNNYII